MRKTQGKLMMVLGEQDEIVDNARSGAIFNEMKNVKHKKMVNLGPGSFKNISESHHYMISEERSYEVIAKEMAIFLARIHDNVNIKTK